MKKGRKLWIIVAVLLLLTVTVSAAMLHYDYDGDGKIGSRDAIYLAKHLTDPEGYPLNPPADADGNGETNQADALYLLRHSLDPDRYPLYIDHTPEIVPAKEATCTENGLTEGVRCAVCHEILTPQQEIPALGHDPDESLWLKDVAGHWRKCRRTICADKVNEAEHSFTQWLAVPAGGCSLQDYHVRACLTCGHCETDLDGDVLHAHQWAIENLAPTCTQPGYSNRVYCVNCDTEVYKTDEPALGHDWEGAIWSITPLTHSRTCQRKDCGYIEKGNHLFGAWITEQEYTCTDFGSRYKECTVCKEKVYENIPPRHDLVYTEAKNPTCTEKGWFAYESCTRCSYSTYQERPELGHLIDESAYHNDEQNHWHYCQRADCDYIKNVNSHSFSQWVTVQEQTCTQDGISERTCTVCKYKETDITKAKHNYDLEHWVTDENSHWHQCLNCGKRTDIADHQPGQWTVTIQPTCETVGKETTNCLICDTLMERSITITHDYTGAAWSSDSKEHWHNCIRPGCTSRIDVSAHSWGEWIIDTAATCETEGLKHRNCAVCNYLQSEVIPAKGHSYYNAPWQKDADNHWKVCIRDGCDHIGELSPHKFGNWTVRSNSTCTEAGEEYRTCSCGHEETRALTILGHDLTGSYKSDKDGHWQVCSRCPYQTKPESHSYGQWMITKEESCTDNGSKKHTCTVCKYTETETIDEIDGHLNSQWLFNDEMHYKHCDRCQSDYDYANHRWQVETVDATCTTGAYTLKTCEVCKHEIKTFISDPLGHNWQTDYDETSHWEYCDRSGCKEVKPQQPHSMGAWKTTTAAGCEEKGEETAVCTGCPYSTTRETDPLGHDFSDWIAFNEKRHYRECGRCQLQQFEQHKWTVNNIVTAGCETGGYTEYKCSDCGQTEQRDITDPLGHTDGQNDTSWNHNDTYHWLTCIRCGEQYRKDPHKWTNWTTDVAADCENPGNEYRTCTVCNRREDKTIPAEGHDHSGSWIQGDSTHYKICGKTGCGKRIDEAIHSKGTVQKNDTHHWYTCTVCGKTPVDQAAHTYGDWKTETPATCTSEGLQKRYCTVCDQADSQTKILTIIPHDLYFTVDTRQIQQTGEIVYEHTVVEKCRYKCDYRVVIGDTVIHIHNEVDTIVTPATCTENGSVVVKCKVPGCEDVFLTQELPALGHNFVDGICTRCGLSISQGLEFTLSSDGTYYIVSGIGTCTDTEIIIPDTHEGLPVKEIGDNAFERNRSITGVTMPEGIISIGNSAFLASGLTALEFPDSLTHIGEEAFAHCNQLTEVTIGDSVTDIGAFAFYCCQKLNNVYIGKNVSAIGLQAFELCITLEGIWVEENNENYCSDQKGVLFNEDMTRLIQAPFLLAGTYQIPDSVATIGTRAFYNCSYLTGVTFPDSVTTIEDYAFYYCTGLTSLTFGKNLTTIGENAFKDCSNLTEVTFPNALTSIGVQAFMYCKNITTMYYEGTTALWKQIQKGKNWDSYYSYELICLWDVNGSEGLEYILGSDGYFVAGIGTCTDTEIVIPDTYMGTPVVGIHEGAFRNETSITSVTMPDSVIHLGFSAFNECTSLKYVTLSNNIWWIGQYAFYGCTSLTEITIPDSATFVGEGAFYSCTSLKKAVIGQNVTRIDRSAFECCTSLTEIVIPDKVTTIGESAFHLCYGATSITIGKGVTSIGRTAFSRCTSVTAITIPKSVTSIAEIAFSCCNSLTAIQVEAGNTVYHSAGNCLIETATKTLLTGCQTSQIPADGTVTSIGRDAFIECTGLRSITIPEGVTSIGEGAFHSCCDLEITIPVSVTSIGDAAMTHSTNITVYYTGTSAQWEAITKGYLWDLYTNYELICLGDAIGTQGLEYVLSDDGTYYIVSGIGSCTDTEIEIPDTHMDKPVKVVADSAFINCTDIISITINAESIEQQAFYGCTNLTTLTIGSNVATIGMQAFQNCRKLVSVNIENGVSSILGDAFSGCTSLTSITIPDSVTTMEDHVFFECSKLSNVVLSNNIETIPWEAFGGCTSLKQITIPENVRCIEQQAFSGCTGLTSFVIPDRVEKIEQYAFENCTGMKSVTIGNGVWSIEEHAFVNCTGLTAVHITDMDTWCYIGFTDAYSNPLTYAHKLYLNGSLVTQVILYEYLDWVNYYTFTGCTSITSVVIPEWTIIISEQAFNGCTNLKYVYYAGTASQWKSVTIESGNNTVKNARIYYYSAKRPSSNAGNYWHYVNGVPTLWA